jgi:hypothetical protein
MDPNCASHINRRVDPPPGPEAGDATDDQDNPFLEPADFEADAKRTGNDGRPVPRGDRPAG